jgi:hypothetical protein
MRDEATDFKDPEASCSEGPAEKVSSGVEMRRGKCLSLRNEIGKLDDITERSSDRRCRRALCAEWP